jgi:flavodoxin
VIGHWRATEVIEMNSIVIYASHFGNTKKVAEAIADGLRSRGTAQALPVEEVVAALPAGTDLVVIGGPTEGHRMTRPMAQFLDGLEASTWRGVAAATFDTRLRWPNWLSGSAAAGIAKKLRRMGAQVIIPEESFLVEATSSTREDKGPELYAGELERATRWGASLAARVEALAPATAV